MLPFLKRMLACFFFKPAAKKERGRPTEPEIDKTLKDSFPASDPPGGY